MGLKCDILKFMAEDLRPVSIEDLKLILNRRAPQTRFPELSQAVLAGIEQQLDALTKIIGPRATLNALGDLLEIKFPERNVVESKADE